MRKYFYHIFILFFAGATSLAQNELKIIETHFVKKGKILFRIAPKNKKIFYDINTNAIKITRYNVVNGNLTNELVIEDMLKSYWDSDTSNWMRLYRKDKDKTGFIYNALYQNAAGSGLSPQQKEQQEKMIYDLMLLSCDFDAEVARACGLFFEDSTIDNSQKYIYKLAMYTSSLSLNTNSLLTIAIDASQLSSNKNISDLKGKNKNNLAQINWKAIDYKSDYSGYNVYCSEDSIHWQKINASPIVLLSTQFEPNKQFIYYNDTMRLPNKRYFYHIKGINFFGEESKASNVITLKNYPAIHSVPLIDSVKVIQNRMVSLRWRMEKQSETNLPERYILMRAEKDNGQYKTIFETKDKLRFTDTKPLSSNFYKVGAITFNNDTLFSYSRMAVIIDTIAPHTVSGLKAIVDKKGLLTLSWKKNAEKDMLGYKVFRSNRAQDEFVQVNGKYIVDTFYVEKLNLNTLSKKIYYKLAASDNNHNSSVLSESIEVSRPDTIAPAAPIIFSVSQKQNGLLVHYILSKSNDVKEQCLSRKKYGETEFLLLHRFKADDSSGVVLDSLIEQGQSYSYKLKSTDEDGNYSVSKEMEMHFETGYRNKIGDISYTVDRTEKKINLAWKYDEKNIEKFIVYRAKKNEVLTLIKTLEGNASGFTDKTVSIGNIYEYRIKAALVSGAETIISNPIIIEY